MLRYIDRPVLLIVITYVLTGLLIYKIWTQL